MGEPEKDQMETKNPESRKKSSVDEEMETQFLFLVDPDHCHGISVSLTLSS